MTSFTPPPGYARVRVVSSFEEMLATPFDRGVNALCWPRTLAGDFAEVAAALAAGEGISALDEDILQSLPLGAAGRLAVGEMLADLRRLREQGLAPELNGIRAYPRDVEPGAVRTDVYSFHADSATVEADTWLCTYHGSASEGLRNDEARRRIDVPAIRAALLEEFGGGEGEKFRGYLRDCCYDLHYASLPEARPFSFGRGHLWRIATDWPGSPVPPCVHRAPETIAGELRLLLIS